MRKVSKSKVLLLAWMLIGCGSAYAGGSDDEAFDVRMDKVIRQLDADVEADPGLASVLAALVGTEYQTPRNDLEWALGESISWGRIAVLAYMDATTGRGFEQLMRQGAPTHVEEFVADMEMNHETMIHSLEKLARMVARERNSRIFDRLRSARRFDSQLPDLGAGFGLFQESLDFRQIGPPSPTKVHTGSTFLGKGDGGGQ